MYQARIMIRGLATAALLLCTLPPAAQAQARCEVVDPELQGSYEGGCVDGKAEGRGTAKGTATYTGEFHLGKKHGKGIKIWPWGDRYEGEFSDDYRDGLGIYTWGERSLFAGDRYDGAFARDKRNGYGVYFWESGDAYAGPWKDDAVAGLATPMMIARFRATNAAMEALSKPGTKVCHDSIVGSGKAVSAEAETQVLNEKARQVSVRITKLGPAPTLVAGTAVAVGDVVWDDPINWIPCN